MKSNFKILILTFVLASCNKNISSSNDISSSFINYPEIDATIVDPGNNNLKKTDFKETLKRKINRDIN